MAGLLAAPIPLLETWRGRKGARSVAIGYPVGTGVEPPRRAPVPLRETECRCGQHERGIIGSTGDLGVLGSAPKRNGSVPVIRSVTQGSAFGRSMPRISQFYGISIYMYYGDHAPPHLHAIYGDCEAVVNIQTGAVIAGDLPRRAGKLLMNGLRPIEPNCSKIGNGPRVSDRYCRLIHSIDLNHDLAYRTRLYPGTVSSDFAI